MSYKKRNENRNGGYPRLCEKVTTEMIEFALAQARIQVVETVRVNNCGTNFHLEGGGIFSLYDSGRLLLQGKPSADEANLFNTLVRQSEPRATVAPKHEMEEWQEWLAAHHSERQE